MNLTFRKEDDKYLIQLKASFNAKMLPQLLNINNREKSYSRLVQRGSDLLYH